MRTLLSMALEFGFTPASERHSWWNERVLAEIDGMLPEELHRARSVTIDDMGRALAALTDELPGWRVTIEGHGESWTATLENADGEELGMYAYGEAPYEVSLQGFSEEVFAVLGKRLVALAGPQVFAGDGGEGNEILFRPVPSVQSPTTPSVRKGR
jgi:hypothetical protein